MEEYVRLYGEKVWTYSTFVTNSALISNYILPLIGQKEMKLNAKRFETAFYAQPNEGQNPGMDIEKIAEQLRRSPELMRLLVDLLQTKSSENGCQNISNAHL